MAIQRSTVAQITTEIRRNIGEPTAARSHITDANLYLVINRYLQELSVRCTDALKSEGRLIDHGVLRFDMWRTTWESTTANADSTLVVTAASSVVYLPSNYDHYLSFYDKTHGRPIEVVHSPNRWFFKIEALKNMPAGPPEAIEIQGYTTNTHWVRRAVLYPSTAAGVTPSLTLEGWRLPAAVTASSDYLDIDPKWEELVVVGVAAELTRKDDPNYNRFQDKERSLLMQLAGGAGAR